ncbi:WD repeat and SOCS box-containing protein 2 [Parambassis ranga]|uniref:WD repeat and SOCS box-containing protein 2 n=1 Tax=Parambassis ranga TaxID=210632 RepID=A0A6P7J2M1_9TELE|nr:WD repeat and SOCS box-containing protein 2 [Parambassis ranga]XP_028270792.1 WD repeat and SOCS box-containing protein 2 [Parambassis ranga]
MCSMENSAELQATSSDPALLLELKTRRPPSLLERAGCETWSVDFSPDGAWFAWSMGHGIVWVVAWPLDSEDTQNAETDRGDKSFSCGHPVWGLAFGPRPPKSSSAAAAAAAARPAKTKSKGNNSLLLATGLENGVIKIWNVLTGDAVFDLHGHEGIVRHLVFPQNGTLTLISSSRDKTLRIWDLAHKGKKVQVLSGHKDWISCCSVSSDCSMIASVGRFDRMVCLWSLRSYKFIRNLTGGTQKTLYLLSSCDFSPDGAVLATAAFSGSSWWIDLWDPYTAERLATLVDYFEDYGQNQISAIQFSPSGLHLTIVTDDRALRIWEPGERGMVMQTKRDRESNGLCCNYHPEGGVVATGTRDGHVRFWRAPRMVPSLCHLCRSILRHSVSTHQIEALPLPKRILEYLTYRNIPERLKTCCSSDEEEWET